MYGVMETGTITADMLEGPMEDKPLPLDQLGSQRLERH